METEELIKLILNCAFQVRKVFTAGLHESVYENALCIEMKKHGLHVERQVDFNVYYDKQIVGTYRADIIVEGKVIIELKAVNEIIPAHEIQLVNYLNIAGIDNGLILNFGALSQLEIKRKYRIYRPRQFHKV
jgi:GxxExxY protein